MTRAPELPLTDWRSLLRRLSVAVAMPSAFLGAAALVMMLSFRFLLPFSAHFGGSGLVLFLLVALPLTLAWAAAAFACRRLGASAGGTGSTALVLGAVVVILV